MTIEDANGRGRRSRRPLAHAFVGLLVALTLSATAQAAAPPDDSQPLPTIAAVSASSHVDPRLSTAASKLAGQPVTVRCLSTSDWIVLAQQIVMAGGSDMTSSGGGYTSPDHERINMSPDLCSLVARFTYKGYFPYATYAKTLLGWAIHTVAHESEHAAGHPEETIAECYGQQLTATVARLLKSTVKLANARLLAQLAWTGYALLPDSYHSPECRDGGPLDLHPSSTIWP